MKFVSLIVLFGVVALSAGCIEPPQRRDAFASLSASNAAYKDLTIGLILSDNTKEATRYANEFGRMQDSAGMGIFIGTADAANKIFEGLAAVFQRNFKTVVKIEKVEDAQTVNADLIVLLDVFLHDLQVTAFTEYKIDIGHCC